MSKLVRSVHKQWKCGCTVHWCPYEVEGEKERQPVQNGYRHWFNSSQIIIKEPLMKLLVALAQKQ